MSEFAGDLPNRRRSKMDKIAVNAFIHGGALSDPIELNRNISYKKRHWFIIFYNFKSTARCLPVTVSTGSMMFQVYSPVVSYI